uniref:Serine/threonine-protein phosphatase 2A regulatory subunit B'' subunit alpha n=1 Tax=Mus musculus TaxID=10090 RepID=Q3UPT6_MOUSE|nr:unnamed protein product [Mus musculus]
MPLTPPIAVRFTVNPSDPALTPPTALGPAHTALTLTVITALALPLMPGHTHSPHINYSDSRHGSPVTPPLFQVIQRIFYTVNRSWSGMISREELRRSSFLQAVSQLEVEPDINRMTSFFSYEHFYVIYCKFWELDLDRDLTIDRSDLARHGDGAISSRMIDRIFSGAVTRARLPRKVGKLSYADFVWFLLSEEDKTTPTSTEYWFRCMDLDGDGALSMFELEFFYEEQAQRMAARGVEPLPFHDLARQVLDLVAPRCPGRITLRDLKQCGLAGEFFDAFFNVDKYLAREQREQAGTPQDTDSDPAASAWDRYAAEEYDFLVAEEAMAEDDDDHDEGSDPIDLYGLADEDCDDLEPL